MVELAYLAAGVVIGVVVFSQVLEGKPDEVDELVEWARFNKGIDLSSITKEFKERKK